MKLKNETIIFKLLAFLKYVFLSKLLVVYFPTPLLTTVALTCMRKRIQVQTDSLCNPPDMQRSVEQLQSEIFDKYDILNQNLYVKRQQKSFFINFFSAIYPSSLPFISKMSVIWPRPRTGLSIFLWKQQLLRLQYMHLLYLILQREISSIKVEFAKY